MNTPVALLVFNRPALTARVFAAIRIAKPRNLFLIADGPRDGNPADLAACRSTRSIVDQVDWPCQLECDFSAKNLGCRQRVISGLDWVFSKVDRAIILEDDCLPSISFFPFCHQLLDHYANTPRVMSISGCNFVEDRFPIKDSYYFSRYASMWGWATWRRVWQTYDGQLGDWGSRQSASALNCYLRDGCSHFWQGRLDACKSRELDTWDYQFLYTIWKLRGCSIIPRANLVQNLGWGPCATHCHDSDSFLGNLPTSELPLPLLHPRDTTPNRSRDLLHCYRLFRGRQTGPKFRHRLWANILSVVLAFHPANKRTDPPK